MHHCEFVTKLRWMPSGQFLFETTAKWKDKHVTCLRQYESGAVKVRYMYSSHYAGTLVCFPDEKLPYYFYSNERQARERFSDLAYGNIPFIAWGDKEKDLKEISDKRDDLKYLCRKFKKGSLSDFLKTVSTYKQHPEIEPLIQLGLNSIASNKMFWKMREDTRKRLCSFIKQRIPEIEKAKSLPDCQDYDFDLKLSAILRFMKDGGNICDQIRAEKYKISASQVAYCKRKGVEPSDYRNYIDAVKKTSHDLKDPYWLYPNDFQKRFDKAMAEQEAIDEVRSMAENNKFDHGIYNYKKLSVKTMLRTNGMLVYIPYEVEDIVKQATKLNQCLVNNGYIEAMANNKTILVFVKKDDGTRLATAEINWNKKLLQIYGHEYGSDRERSAATKEERDAVDEFIAKSGKLRKPAISKIRSIKADGLFFKGVDGNLKDKYKKNKYLPGMIFDTGCKDKDFSDSCVSTDKAIHFCKNPADISRFFPGATKYVVVEALGKVCHRGEEYISNRVRIVSVLNVGSAS